MKSALFSAFLISLATASARDPLDRPNVVLIFLDDSGYGDYSHNGNPTIETPAISKIANAGANFTQFYVTTPACSASRYALLTGRYPGHSGFGSWVIGPGAKPHLRTTETTIAEGLQTRGYATGMFGKWHLGNPNKGNGMTPDALPLAHGFDEWIGTNVSHDYADAKLLRSDADGDDPVAGYSEIARDLPSDDAASTSLTGRYTDAAVDFIKENKDKPFFAYIAHNQPHLGLYVSDKFKGTSRRGLLGDVMAEIDDSVARILAAVKDSGVERNTLVIFSSDNGPWIMFQNTEKHPKYDEARMHVGYALPFRDGKGSCWEGGHRVAGVFYWPGVIPAKRQLEPASTLDVLPTVFALCGVETKSPRDGRDIRPFLAPDRFKGDVAPFELAYCAQNNLPIAYREGPWKIHTKLISQTGDSYGFKASHEQPLLFNVEEDLGERIDRAAEHPDIVERLRKKLDVATDAMRSGS